MSACQSIDCCPAGVFTYGVTGTLTPGPPVPPLPPDIVVDPAPPPVYRLMLSDTFDGENGGVPVENYFDFEKCTVPPGGSVDLIDATTFPAFAANHLFVDMNGTVFPGANRGQLLYGWFTFVPGTYRLSFDNAGAQSGFDKLLTIQIGRDDEVGAEGVILDESLLIPTAQAFVTTTYDFVITFEIDGKILFTCPNEGLAGPDMGCLLDNIKLEQIA